MDKSDRYIDMCRKADDIQHRWHQAYGDFYVDGTGRVTCWIPGKDRRKKLRGGVCITTERDVIRLDHLVWLPKLNQLMELAQEPGVRFESMTQRFFSWCKTGYPVGGRLPAEVFSSLEQHWLAFVMMKDHCKGWDNSQRRWI
jgi:hypothetical protein